MKSFHDLMNWSTTLGRSRWICSLALILLWVLVSAVLAQETSPTGKLPAQKPAGTASGVGAGDPYAAGKFPIFSERQSVSSPVRQAQSQPGDSVSPTRTLVQPDYYKELKRFRQVKAIIQKNYIKEVSDKDLIDGAISGMLRGLRMDSSALPAEVFAHGSGQYYDLRRYKIAIDTLKKNRDGEVPMKQLVDSPIAGMLQSLDPHSWYLPEEQFKELKAESPGAFAGIGVEITLVHGALTIVSPLDDVFRRPSSLIRRSLDRADLTH